VRVIGYFLFECIDKRFSVKYPDDFRGKVNTFLNTYLFCFFCCGAWDMSDEMFASLCMHLEKEINLLKSEISEKNARVKTLEQQLTALQQYDHQLQDMQENYNKEQDRLTKLYHEYERSEAEVKRLREELDGWKDWVESNKDLYDRLFSASPPKFVKATVEK
jgi:septal ring factor EnvC (AmiA/AmiB activator)